METSTASIVNPSLVVNPSPSSGAVHGSSAAVDLSPSSGPLDYSSVPRVSSSFDSAAVDPAPSVDCISAVVEPASSSGVPDRPAVELSPLSGALHSAGVIPPSSVVFWGVLGIGAATVHHYNMVSDFCYWTHIFTRSPGFDEHRSTFQALRSVQPFFPDGKGIFGDARREHLKYPLHPSLLHPSFEPDISATDFKAETLFTLIELSTTMGRSETLVLLLICDGSTTDDGTYRLWLTTGAGLRGEDSFTVKQLERAVKRCQARIVVVCNAHQSAHLASKRWTLICAAGPTQHSDALAQSLAASGNIRGGMFTLCVTARVAAAFGLKVPLPRDEGRALVESLSEPDALISRPSSPPDHTSGPSTSQLPIYKPTAYFQLISNSESAEDLAWYDILPSEFTESMVHATAIHPDNMPRFKEPQRHGGGPQPETRIGIPSDSDACFQTLVRLASAYVQLDTRYTQESRDSGICAAVLRHVENPTNPWPLQGWEGDFCDLLQRRNIQAVAVQQIAQGLGWWSREITVTPFVERPGRSCLKDRDEMIGAGMPIDQIPERLGKLFEGMDDLMEPSPIFWLVARWVGVDRPRVAEQQWERVVAAAVDATAASDALIR